MSNIKIFENHGIRTHWDEETEEWFFSVVDVVGALSESANPTDYLKKMRKRDVLLGDYIGTNCPQVDMKTDTGKLRKTLAATTKQVLRIVQSIPSPKAEPFKLWLAEIGSDRLNEMADPEKAILRGADYYRQKGYSEGWINQRLQTIEMRKELTDEWKERGIELEKQYAILTNEMTKAWSGLSVREYKNLKNLKKENLRDNMTNIELVLNMLAEVTTTGISKNEKPKTFSENKAVAKRGGNIAKNARLEYEKEINQSIVSPINANSKNLLEVNAKEDISNKENP
ncbi:MAG: phage antirepressor protein [Firmicutes bacterium]|nr:phage antirepressor protein [Bacillota bacterium]